MIKKITIISLILITLISCSGSKKDDLNKLSITMKNIDSALKSSDREHVEAVLGQIDYLLPRFPKHQSLREKKYKLEIKIKEYDKAIETINSIIQINPGDIDNRIVKGILFEIKGHNAKSDEVFNRSLQLIDEKLNNIPNDSKIKYQIQINRVLILKLLNMDREEDYNLLETSPMATKYPALKQLLSILKRGSREQIIYRYR